jgi:hypothetical protein
MIFEFYNTKICGSCRLENPNLAQMVLALDFEQTHTKELPGFEIGILTLLR